METYWFVYVTIVLVGLVQVPIGIDLLRFVFPKWKLARLASRSVHTLLFVTVGSIFLIGISYHLFVYLPLLAGQGRLQALKAIVHVAFALWVWCNVVGNYFYSVCLHPGLDKDYMPPRRGPPVLCYMSEEGVITAARESDDEDQSTVFRGHTAAGSSNANNSSRSPGTANCFYCDISLVGSKGPPKSGPEWSPTRTHYCKICECAIPYLDHHCPFTGNCAGFRNYSNFFLGLVYGVVGLFYAVVITLPYFFDCNLKNVLWYFGLSASRVSNPVCAELGPHSHIFLPVFAGFCVTGNMLLIQMLLLASDLSTYNVLSNWSRFPMFRFILERIRAGKFHDKDSRWNVLIKRQRKSWLHYLVPVRNSSRTSLT